MRYKAAAAGETATTVLLTIYQVSSMEFDRPFQIRQFLHWRVGGAGGWPGAGTIPTAVGYRSVCRRKSWPRIREVANASMHISVSQRGGTGEPARKPADMCGESGGLMTCVRRLAGVRRRTLAGTRAAAESHHDELRRAALDLAVYVPVKAADATTRLRPSAAKAGAAR